MTIEDQLAELEAKLIDVLDALSASGNDFAAARVRARCAHRQAQRDKAANKGSLTNG